MEELSVVLDEFWDLGLLGYSLAQGGFSLQEAGYDEVEELGVLLDYGSAVFGFLQEVSYAEDYVLLGLLLELVGFL